MALLEGFLLLETLVLLFWRWARPTAKRQGQLGWVALWLVTFVTHSLLNGWRWQMIPIYVSGSLLSAVLFSTKTLQRRFWRSLAFILVLLMVFLGGVLSYLMPRFRLPQPSVRVGTQLLTWTHEGETIHGKLWYPAAASSMQQDVYCRASSERLDGLFGMPGWIFSYLDLIPTSGYENAPIPNTPAPLLIYGHGASSAYIDNTALLHDLAARGYWVLSVHFNFSFKRYGISADSAMVIDLARQRTLVDNLCARTVPVQAQLMGSVFDAFRKTHRELAAAIDWTRVGALGHSLGGTTAQALQRIEPSIRAVVNLDGPVVQDTTATPLVPLLYISSFDHRVSNEQLRSKRISYPELYRALEEDGETALRQHLALLRQQGVPYHWVRLTTAGHLDMTDLPYLFPMMATAGADKAALQEATTALLAAFFEQYLSDEEKQLVLPEYSVVDILEEG